jgi:hypothetical protein
LIAELLTSGVIGLVWAGLVTVALCVREPFGLHDSHALASAWLEPASGGYLGFCPMPLVIYFCAAMLCDTSWRCFWSRASGSVHVRPVLGGG